MDQVTAQTAGKSASGAPRQGHGPLFYMGAAGLLTAMAVEVVAVAGRQISWPLHGALEIIQTAMLLTASASMLSATLGDAHATVHLVTDRLRPAPKVWLQRFAALLATMFFVGLAAGSAWLTLDYWHVHEESELLHIPFRPLRVLSFLSVVAIAGVFVRRSLAREAQRR